MGALYRGDCREVLPTLPPESVQLVVTSPPYNIGWNYADGGAGDNLPLEEYQEFLSETFRALWGVLRPGGVLALNLPATIRSDPHRAYPIGAWAQMRLMDMGWALREPVVWVKSRDAKLPPDAVAAENGYALPDEPLLDPFTPLAMGTAIGAPSNPYLRPTWEFVILASKGGFRVTGKKGGVWMDGLDHYMDYLKDTWVMPPGRAVQGRPLAYPEQLVNLCVRLFSSVDDVVLDPFGGTGTTGKVASKLGRVPWLIEREPKFWPELEVVTDQPLLIGMDL